MHMKKHTIRVYPSKEPLKKEDQFAWKLASISSDPVEVKKDVVDMIINRVIDTHLLPSQPLTERL